MFSPQLEWSCSRCRSTTFDRRKYCIDCHSMLSWSCIGSGKSGLYTNYYRHRDSRNYCGTEEEKQERIQEKQEQFRALDDGN